MALNENPTLDEIINEAERLNNLIIDRGGAKTITPSTSNQVLGRGNYKGDITVLGDGDLISTNIKKGVNIFGVEGSILPSPDLNTSASWSSPLNLANEYYITGYGDDRTVPLFSLNNNAINGLILTTNFSGYNVLFDYSSSTSGAYLRIVFNTGEIAYWVAGTNSWSNGTSVLGNEIYAQQIGNYIIISYSTSYGSDRNFYQKSKIIKLTNPNSRLGESRVELYASKNQTSGSGSGLRTDSSSAILAYKTCTM